MRFHAPSFLLGVGVTLTIGAFRSRLRPAVVELGALAVHVATLARALVERCREDLEDLKAEVDERARVASEEAPTNGHATQTRAERA